MSIAHISGHGSYPQTALPPAPKYDTATTGSPGEEIDNRPLSDPTQYAPQPRHGQFPSTRMVSPKRGAGLSVQSSAHHYYPKPPGMDMNMSIRDEGPLWVKGFPEEEPYSYQKAAEVEEFTFETVRLID